MNGNKVNLNPELMDLLKGIDDNPELRAYFMSQILESSYELEQNLKNLPGAVDERIKEQITLSIHELTEKLTLIRETIKELPSELDQQVASMLNVIQQSHEATTSNINLLQDRINTSNGIALNAINETLKESVKENESTTRHMAWMVIGATFFINIIFFFIMYLTR